MPPALSKEQVTRRKEYLKQRDKMYSIEKDELFPLLEQRFDMCNKVCDRSEIEDLLEPYRDAYQPNTTPQKISEIIQLIELTIKLSLLQRLPVGSRDYYKEFSLERLCEDVTRLYGVVEF
ncbi:hypothetical protein BO83DRAFT_391257 [Aspergillus eucalypticola CBS 122712]|uniref:Uncharacterized protein n=1 Tax=Aspergillus eucalypticola (strain CBS 122712 / IBT 29274) TaxID=1448314 RepID=A0A317V2X5_ASPEC|nr:uncharacterized protein BO83DRAFT_391257 [Aspergillus eucalypticola CBS 122712]PWY67408.1 hypothetical protein BO83DRAFT_391257 [Aspergillus eucalypticola CBS 122712]